MTEYACHTLLLVGDTQQESRSTKSKDVQTGAVLGPDTSTVEVVGAEPGEQTFRGAYRGNDSEVMMTELVELTDNGAPDYDAVAFYGNDSATDEDGYYALSGVRPERPRPATRKFWTYRLSLDKTGTNKTHKRAVTTAITALNTSPPANPFGTNATVTVGIPNASAAPRWFDSVNKSYEAATPETAAVDTQYATVDLYNTSVPTFANPTIVYDLDYAEEGKTDLNVWDTTGSASRTSGGLLQWARVFDPGHSFTGDAVMENGRLRLTFNESDSSLSAEEWNETASDYDDVSLGASNETLEDVDFDRIGMQRASAQVVWFNTSDSTRYHTDMELRRGQNKTLVTVPTNEDRANFPAGLNTLLSPIASGLDDDAGDDKGLVRREDTRL